LATTIRTGVTHSFAIALTAVALGCNRSPTSPGPVPPTPTPQARTLTVVSGWDQNPVAGAQVRVDDEILTADANAGYPFPRDALARHGPGPLTTVLSFRVTWLVRYARG
jgi:hypothetical protein